MDARRRLPVRFCRTISAQAAGANSEAEKIHYFLADDIYSFHSWNSSITFVNRLEDCVDKLIHNETDIFPAMDIYGMHAHAVKYFAIMRDSKGMITSSYEPVNQTADRIESTGSLAQLSSYSPAVATMTFSFLLIFLSLFSMQLYDSRLRVRIRKLMTLKMMGKLLLKQQLILRPMMRTPLFRYLLLLLIFLVSSLHFSFIAFTKTELVILDEPFVFDSFEKLIEDPKIKTTWLQYEKTYLTFMNAIPGSPEQRLWSKNCANDARNCLSPLTGSMAADVVQRLSRRELAIIMADYAAVITNAGLCPLARLMSLNPIILRDDKMSSSVPLALGYSKFLPGFLPEVTEVIDGRGQRAAQSGIILMIGIPTKSPMSSISDSASVRKCMHPEQDPPEEPTYILSKSLSDYKILLIISCCINVAAFVILIIRRQRNN
jgi:hypothetical protein